MNSIKGYLRDYTKNNTTFRPKNIPAPTTNLRPLPSRSTQEDLWNQAKTEAWINKDDMRNALGNMLYTGGKIASKTGGTRNKIFGSVALAIGKGMTKKG